MSCTEAPARCIERDNVSCTNCVLILIVPMLRCRTSSCRQILLCQQNDALHCAIARAVIELCPVKYSVRHVRGEAFLDEQDIQTMYFANRVWHCYVRNDSRLVNQIPLS